MRYVRSIHIFSAQHPVINIKDTVFSDYVWVFVTTLGAIRWKWAYLSSKEGV